jgi:hypothetical protein
MVAATSCLAAGRHRYVLPRRWWKQAYRRKDGGCTLPEARNFWIKIQQVVVLRRGQVVLDC